MKEKTEAIMPGARRLELSISATPSAHLWTGDGEHALKTMDSENHILNGTMPLCLLASIRSETPQNSNG
jgi:hypothetical protein